MGLEGGREGEGEVITIIYDKQVTQYFYVIICVDINIVT